MLALVPCYYDHTDSEVQASRVSEEQLAARGVERKDMISIADALENADYSQTEFLSYSRPEIEVFVRITNLASKDLGGLDSLLPGEQAIYESSFSGKTKMLDWKKSPENIPFNLHKNEEQVSKVRIGIDVCSPIGNWSIREVTVQGVAMVM
jgi:hypothetical protein